MPSEAFPSEAVDAAQRPTAAGAERETDASRATDAAPGLTVAAGTAQPVRCVGALELLGERRELVIVHAGREYRLRITRNDKLILTA